MDDREILLKDDVKLLEQYGAEHPDYFYVLDERGFSPLHKAILLNSYKIVEYLVKNPLIDVLQTTSRGWDCLSLALLADKTSNDIVKRLIDGDSDFKLVDKCFEFGYVFEMELNDKLRTMIETLKNRFYTVPKTTNMAEIIVDTKCDPEKFRYLCLENYKFLAINKKRDYDMFFISIICICEKLIGSSHGEQSKWLSVVVDLFSLFFDEYPDDFATLLVTSLAEMRKTNLNLLINWCIEAWYMAESNKHRGLVEKLLKQPKDIQVVDVIIGLHSLISTLKLKDYSFNNYVYGQIVKFLFESASKLKVDDLLEIGRVLGPKLVDRLFQYAFYKYFSEVLCKKDNLKKNVFNIFKVIDHMQIGSKIQGADNVFVLTSKMSWLPLMAFSTTVSVDAYLLEAQKHLDEFVITKSSTFNFIASEWRKVKESETLAQFRENSSLKSVCRSKIREMLLESHRSEMSHSQLVENVKLLGLTKVMEQYLLFNYSDYEF